MNILLPTRVLIWTCLLSVLSMASPLMAQAPDEFCLLCEENHPSEKHTVQYKGREIPLCSDKCQEHFYELESSGRLDPVTQKIEPRAALFQADSAERGIERIPFWIGTYIFLGVLFGGASSFVAVRKGIGSRGPFFLGLFFNLPGLLITMMRPGREMTFQADGLRKVPTTHNSQSCPACSKRNHPSASQCVHCGSTLTPQMKSEVNRMKS